MTLRPRFASALTLASLLALAPALGCIGTAPPGAATDNAPMGTWPDWQVLTPMVEVAKGQTSPDTIKALETARKLLSQNKPLSADRSLAKATNSSKHWIAVARANVAALYFTTCIRGVAWRLQDGADRPARSVDFGPDTAVMPGDVSVEAMLTNLDDALTQENKVLATQARVARVRVTSFVTSCSPNETVQERADSIMRSDLATLAAEGHLTPDLAYVWAGIQLQEYSAAAARPFLEQARSGGFDDPSLIYLQAIAALDQGFYDEADQRAQEALEAYKAYDDTMQQAQCVFVRGEASRLRGQAKQAREHYEGALDLEPAHVAALAGLARLELAANGPLVASEYVHARLPNLGLAGSSEDQEVLRATQNLEALVIMSNEELELAQVVRDAFLVDIDSEPEAIRRGLRYFYAATLDVRLGDYERARGHAVVAKTEFEEDGRFPVDVDAFLEQLNGG